MATPFGDKAAQGLSGDKARSSEGATGAPPSNAWAEPRPQPQPQPSPSVGASSTSVPNPQPGHQGLRSSLEATGRGDQRRASKAGPSHPAAHADAFAPDGNPTEETLRRMQLQIMGDADMGAPSIPRGSGGQGGKERHRHGADRPSAGAAPPSAYAAAGPTAGPDGLAHDAARAPPTVLESSQDNEPVMPRDVPAALGSRDGPAGAQADARKSVRQSQAFRALASMNGDSVRSSTGGRGLIPVVEGQGDALAAQKGESSRALDVGQPHDPWWKALTREKLREFVNDPDFDLFTMIFIVGSCICLALYHPLEPNSNWNKNLERADIAFNCIFTVELALRAIAARGLRGFATPWNCFDVLLIGLGWLALVPSASEGGQIVNTLRALRSLRPLRAMNRLQSLRAVTVCFITALPYMLSVFFLIGFVMLVFAIIALQLFQESYHRKCVDPITGLYELYVGGVLDEFGCGHRSCPADSFPLCAKTNDIIATVSPGFNNLGTSLQSVFQIITLEWSFIYYRTADYLGRASIVFFIPLIVFLTYLMFSILLAVVKERFGRVQSIFNDRLKDQLKDATKTRKRNLAQRAMDKLSGRLSHFVKSQRRSAASRRNRSSVNSRQSNNNSIGAMGTGMGTGFGSQFGSGSLFQSDMSEAESEVEQGWYLQEPGEGASRWARLQHRIAIICTNKKFSYVFLGLIILNTIALAADVPGAGGMRAHALHIINIVFIAFFTIEVVLKIIGMSMIEYMLNGFNVFDLVVVIVSWIELLLAVAGGATSLRALSVLRSLRVLRVLRVLKFMRNLRQITAVLVEAMGSFVSICALLFLFMFVYIVTGLHIFGHIKRPAHLDDPDTEFLGTFNTFIQSFQIVFQVLTLESWETAMYSISSHSKGAQVFFISWVVLGKFILLTLFQGVTLEAFESKYDKHAVRQIVRLHRSMNMKSSKSLLGSQCEDDTPPTKAEQINHIVTKIGNFGKGVLARLPVLPRVGSGRKDKVAPEDSHDHSGSNGTFKGLVPEDSTGAAAGPALRKGPDAPPLKGALKSAASMARIATGPGSATSQEGRSPKTKFTAIVVPLDGRESTTGSLAKKTASFHDKVGRPSVGFHGPTPTVVDHSGDYDDDTDRPSPGLKGDGLIKRARSRAEFSQNIFVIAGSLGSDPFGVQAAGGTASASAPGGPGGPPVPGAPWGAREAAAEAAESKEDSASARRGATPSTRGLSPVPGTSEAQVGAAAAPRPDSDMSARPFPSPGHASASGHHNLPGGPGAKADYSDRGSTGQLVSLGERASAPPGRASAPGLASMASFVGRKTRFAQQASAVQGEEDESDLDEDPKAQSQSDAQEGGDAARAMSDPGDGQRLLSPPDLPSSIPKPEGAAARPVEERVKEDSYNPFGSQHEFTVQKQGENRIRAKRNPHERASLLDGIPLTYEQVMSVENPSASTRFRQWCYSIVVNIWFDRVVMVMILANCGFMLIDKPVLARGTLRYKLVHYSDMAFSVLFGTEALLKIVAFGWIEYFFTLSHFIDFLVWLVIVVYLAAESVAAEYLKPIRALRALKPLRILSQFKGMKQVLRALVMSLAAMIHVTVLISLFYLAFGIMSVQLFGGAFWSCNDKSVDGKKECIGTFTDPSTGAETARVWSNPRLNFDNLGHAFQALFFFVVMDSYLPILYKAMSVRGIDLQPKFGVNGAAFLFFLTFIVVVALMLLNIYIGVMFNQFTRIRLLDNVMEQKRKKRIRQKLIGYLKAVEKFDPCRAGAAVRKQWQRDLVVIAESKTLENCMQALTIFNLMVLGASFYNQPKAWTRGQEVIAIVLSFIYIAEAIFKIVALGKDYFKSAWNDVDFAISVVCLVETIIQLAANVDATHGLQMVLRILRIVRLTRALRLIKKLKTVMDILETLMVSMSVLVNVGGLLMIVFFIFAYLGMIVFGRVHRGRYLNEDANFSDMGMALLTLFRLGTNDNIMGIMTDLQVSEPVCSKKAGNCGTIFAIPFVICFVLAVSIVLFNLLTAVVLENWEKISRTKVATTFSNDDIEEFALAWAEAAGDGGRLDLMGLDELLASLQPPLGIDLRARGKTIQAFVTEMHIPVDNGHVMYSRTLEQIVRNAVYQLSALDASGGRDMLAAQDLLASNMASNDSLSSVQARERAPAPRPREAPHA